jgi:YD repeat-containing protein
MKLLLKAIFCFSLSVLSVTGFSQGDGPVFDKMTDVLLPAPNATAIIRYGDASLNKNTGTATLSVPLFSLKGTKLGASVSLGYSSGGIRVDEISSRVGMGWALNAGGVITRTVRGLPDNTSTRQSPNYTVGLNYQTWNFMYRIAETANNNSGGYDPEPDLFNYSFDGNGGSFVLDNAMNPLLIAQNGIKIEKDFTYGAPWNFKVTTTEGIIYFFGGSSATESTKRTTSCGKTFGTYTANSWYLKQIKHPNGEVINFSYSPIEYEYDNGVSQMMYFSVGSDYSCTQPPLATSTCTNITKTDGVLLDSIIAPGTGFITFGYTTRLDCNDKLLSSVTYKDSAANTIGSFDLAHTTYTSSATYDNEYRSGNNKTPYLTGLTEKPSSGSLTKQHYFSYINPEGRPSRLSFSQDHWGYFNGKVNTTLVPNIVKTTPWAEFMFPDATGNREPDGGFAQKGLLQKVVYPTGGTSTFFYEPNSYDEGSDYFTTLHTLSCDVTGSGDWDMESREKTFFTNPVTSVLTKLHIECRANDSIDFTHSHHVKGSVEIVDPVTSAVIFSKEVLPGYSGDDMVGLLLGNYKIVIKSYGSLVTTMASLTFIGDSHEPAVTEKITGGVRVAKIVTANPSEQPMVKKYFYGPVDDLHHSSLFYAETPRYWGEMRQGTPCPAGPGGIVTFIYETLTSSSLVNLGIFNSTQVSYATVTESEGEDFEGGGIESKFYTAIDVKGQDWWNSAIIGSTLSNFSSAWNAKPSSETVIKKMSNGDLTPIKRTVYTYVNDTASQQIIYGYPVSRSFSESSTPDTTCDITIHPEYFGSCYSFLVMILSKYNMMRYHIISSRINPETTTETLWDENGANPVTTVTNSFYESAQHYQLTKSEVANSKGQTLRTTLKYPHDYTGTGDYTAMVSANIISPPVDIKTEILTPPSTMATVAESKTTYAAVGNNNYEPVLLEKSVKGNTLESEGTIDLYDSKGHIQQYTGKNEIVNSIIWGYNYQYPVAKIVGATYAEATAELTGSVAALQSMDGQTLRNELNHIRTGLPAAQVTTYTYKPLIGITSITDPNNKINTYEYDAFNRLLVIRDQDSNAVKKNAYSYAVPDSTTGLTIYYNVDTSQTLTCSTCESGFTGTSVTYTVPAGRYTSLISQADANAQAVADIATYGQDYADKNGTCSNAATCTGVGYKFVSCACELGTKVCESNYNNGNGTYNISYRYHYSDFSYGDLITEVISCSGVDKKVIDCKCETGVRTCETPTDNGDGTYTTTFHYHWSDGSNSADSTETFACAATPDKKIIHCRCETGYKFYLTSTACGKNNPPPGCCLGMWLCTYRYNFSDGTHSATYSECSAEPCTPSIE